MTWILLLFLNSFMSFINNDALIKTGWIIPFATVFITISIRAPLNIINVARFIIACLVVALLLAMFLRVAI